jgi:hypothetical protein
MALDPTADSTMVPCRGCSKDVVVPGGPVRAELRAGREYVIFCTRRCERRYVAREGAKQQEEVANARRDLPDSG